MVKGNLQELIHILPDAPGQTNAAMHDVDVSKTILTRQHSMHIESILSNMSMFVKKLNTYCRIEY